MKSIQFSQQQIKAYINGATMFIIPIGFDTINISSRNMSALRDTVNRKDIFPEEYKRLIWNYSPLQKDDKFFIQEEFASECFIEDGKYIKWNLNKKSIVYKQEVVYRNLIIPNSGFKWQDASQMQEHQARFKDLECVNVELKRVDDIHIAREMEAILGTNFISKSGFINIDSFDILIEQFKQATKELDYISCIQ